MPTNLPRIMLTETEQVSAALEVAQRAWPQDAGSRSRLLLRLIEAGFRAIAAEDERELAERRELIKATAGTATGLYETGYLDRLRQDWPE